jgi:hypothetical protein
MKTAPISRWKLFGCRHSPCIPVQITQGRLCERPIGAREVKQGIEIMSLTKNIAHKIENIVGKRDSHGGGGRLVLHGEIGVVGGCGEGERAWWSLTYVLRGSRARPLRRTTTRELHQHGDCHPIPGKTQRADHEGRNGGECDALTLHHHGDPQLHSDAECGRQSPRSARLPRKVQ